MVTNPGEAVQAYIGLRMSEDIGITATGERVEDTTITKVDMGVASNLTLEATTIDKLTLGHVWTVTICSSRYAWESRISVQINIGAVILVVHILQYGCRRIIRIRFGTLSLTDSTGLTTTENLEGIAGIQIDSGATPDL